MEKRALNGKRTRNRPAQTLLASWCFEWGAKTVMIGNVSIQEGRNTCNGVGWKDLTSLIIRDQSNMICLLIEINACCKHVLDKQGFEMSALKDNSLNCWAQSSHLKLLPPPSSGTRLFAGHCKSPGGGREMVGWPVM